MSDLEKLESQAHQIVEDVSDSPQKRYNLRLAFYKKYGDALDPEKDGLGNSELAFMQWEMRRGVLNPLSGDKSGSPWWRKVNSHFIYLSTLAALIHEAGLSTNHIPIAVQHWLNYIASPNEVTWYKAHNSSIVAGYEVANSLAFKETAYEQYFMSIVLYRLLYAQSMVEGVSFGILGKIFANPRGGAVSIITDINAFYPSKYPMTKEEIAYVLHKAHNLPGVLEDLFDEILILPELDKLYKEASKWNLCPILLQYVSHNKPVYPLIVNDTPAQSHFRNQMTDKPCK